MVLGANCPGANHPWGKLSGVNHPWANTPDPPVLHIDYTHPSIELFQWFGVSDKQGLCAHPSIELYQKFNESNELQLCMQTTHPKIELFQ